MKTRWHRYVLYAASMVMEGCVLYALLALLVNKAAPGQLPVVEFLWLLPLAFGFNLLLQRLKLRRFAGYALNILAWAIFMLLIVKTQLFGNIGLFDSTWLLSLPHAFANVIYAFEPALLAFIGSALSWIPGWRLARIKVGFASAAAEFQFGLAIILIVFFIANLIDVPIDDSIAVVMLFFSAALLGISLGHAKEGTGWLAGLHQGHWSGMLLISIGLVLTLGLAVASIVTPGLLTLFLLGLKWVVGVIMAVVAFLVSLLPKPEPIGPLPGENMTGGAVSENVTLFNIPEPVLAGLRLSWTILVLGLILLALWRISSQVFAWLRRRLSTTGNPEIESMPGAFRADLLAFLRRILYKLFRFRLPSRQRQTGPPDDSIRQVYRQLLRWAAAQGWSRPTSQTPFEYAGTLKEKLPDYAASLQLITERYVGARYGALAPTAAELQELKESWRQISQYRVTRAVREAPRSA